MECGNFKEYLRLECNDNLTSSPNPLSHYVCGNKNSIIVDFVGKVEHLTSDLKAVCDTIWVNISIPHLNRSNHTDYRSYYDNNAVELVIKHHKADFLNFDYSLSL